MTVIAIDGPVASGKGTLARRVAEAYKLAYLDTGSLYRAVAARLLAEGKAPQDPSAAKDVAESLRPEDLQRDDLRAEQVGQGASVVAANQDVRQALLTFQRDFAKTPPSGYIGAVLDGRDIGTVVCPDAELKLFVTASAETRAERRHKELLDRGEESVYARVLEDLRERDERDRNRTTAPLKAADDAVVLDTSDLDADQAFAAACALIEERLGWKRA